MNRHRAMQIMLAMVTASLVVTSPLALARARISLAGVHLGMSRQQARNALGRPLHVSAPGRASAYERWQYRQHLTVSFQKYPEYSPHWAVATVATRSPIDELPGGVHVGSPWSRVEAFKPKFCYRGTYEGLYNYFCQWYPTLKSIKQKPGQTNPTLCKPMIVFAQSEDLQRIAELTLAYQAADGGCGEIVKS